MPPFLSFFIDSRATKVCSINRRTWRKKLGAQACGKIQWNPVGRKGKKKRTHCLHFPTYHYSWATVSIYCGLCTYLPTLFICLSFFTSKAWIYLEARSHRCWLWSRPLWVDFLVVFPHFPHLLHDWFRRHLAEVSCSWQANPWSPCDGHASPTSCNSMKKIQLWITFCLLLLGLLFLWLHDIMEPIITINIYTLQKHRKACVSL